MSRSPNDSRRAQLRVRRENNSALSAATAGKVVFSEHDSLRVLALLKRPPAAPDRSVRAARARFGLP
jgi:hypothetical protein